MYFPAVLARLLSVRVCGTVYGWGRPMADSADLSVDELRRLLRSTSFESCNATGSLAVDREELRRVLSTQLGRELTASELVRLWDSLDVDGDGTVDVHEWRQAGGAVEADGLAGVVRALFQTMLRILPRTPAMRFFKPKDHRLQASSEPSEPLTSRAAGRLWLMAVSAGASTVVFKCHSKCHGAATSHDAFREREAASHFVGGAIGGVLHACFVQPFTAPPPPGAPRWALAPRLAGLRVVVLKDALGFGAFFGVHAEAQRALAAALDGGGAGSTTHLGSSSHLRAVGSSVAAGAAAGSCYHFVSYPFDRALALAHPETQPGALAAAVARHGVGALYRGVLRTAAPGVCMGAVTFGMYDAALRYAEG